MKKPLNRKTFVIQTLRRASYRWPSRNEAMAKARVSRGVYECAHCKQHVGNKEKKMDHVEPVVDPVKGFTTFDEYIERMLPMEHTGYQCLCESCHAIKTALENDLRKETKAIASGKPVKKRKIKKSVEDDLDSLLSELDIDFEDKDE